MGYIRIKHGWNHILVQKHVGKYLFFFDRWKTIQEYPNTPEGERLAYQLAKTITHGFNFRVVR